MPDELVQATSQESFERQLDIFLMIVSYYDLPISVSSFIVIIPRFLPGGFGDPLLLDMEV
ncbi:unnamed protein product [Schistosoma margrebowiei]|uniref:Uncharacterized protein n=1 Tax=Schistosoma margrebowiei TaxID=48269 RepID=A0A3P8AQ36_9TREM|nr:unnamed protein product [Schistosoma margrebowiei]